MFILSAVVFVIILLYIIFCILCDKKVTYKDLNERHVVITGGSSGIGKALAIETVKRGGNITIIGRDEGKLKAAVNEIKLQASSAQRVEYTVLDVTADYNDIEEAFKAAEERLGPIFMLVNCAGMCTCGLFETMKPEDIKYMMDLNYLGSAYPTRYVLPGMRKRNEGILVFVCSEAGLFGIYGYTAYSGGKWGVRGLAEALNMELADSNVRLMISFPPDTDTPGFEKENKTKPEITKKISGSGGLCSPDEIAKTMMYDALNGSTYSVYTATGKLFISLFGCLHNGPMQALIQILLGGVLRFINVLSLYVLNRVVRNKGNFFKQADKKEY